MKLANIRVINLLVCLCLASIPDAFSQNTNLPNVGSDLMATAGNCAVCHTDLVDSLGNDVSIVNHWRSTMMANAARDPYFQAKVSTEVAQFPGLAEVIEDKCANCHTPMAYIEQEAKGQTSRLFGEDGFFNPEHELHQIAMDGVSCALCHQIENEGLGTDDTFSGEFVIDLETAKPDRVNYGPYEDVDVNTMKAVSQFTPVFGAHISEAKLCSSCHTLYTPFVDEAGTEILGTFPEQTPFLEWQNSRFGDGTDDDRTCQSCHMPTAEGAVAIASIPPGMPEREPFNQHHFVGGNAFMIALMGDNIAEINATADQEHFNATYSRTINQFNSNTASVEISDIEVDDTVLRANVAVNNLTGHKFPTGFPSRRAWLHIALSDADGTIIFESGAPEGFDQIAGADADMDVTTFEPHHERITQSDQVQIYESIMNDPEGDVTYTLLRGSGYLKDNRILPEGFNIEQAIDDIQVVGNAANDDSFSGGFDQTIYEIDLGAAQGPFNLEATLYYQAISHGFIHDMNQYDTELATTFLSMYESQEPSHVIVTSQAVENISKDTAVQNWIEYQFIESLK